MATRSLFSVSVPPPSPTVRSPTSLQMFSSQLSSGSRPTGPSSYEFRRVLSVGTGVEPDPDVGGSRSKGRPHPHRSFRPPETLTGRVYRRSFGPAGWGGIATRGQWSRPDTERRPQTGPPRRASRNLGRNESDDGVPCMTTESVVYTESGCPGGVQVSGHRTP